MKRNKFLPIILVVGIVVLIGAIVWQIKGDKFSVPADWTGVEGEPVNVALDFYEGWLAARQGEETDPFTAGVLEYDQVGKDLREHLSTFEGKLAETEEDPVLCQSNLPGGFRTLPVYKKEETAQILVMSTTKGQSGQAVVDMEAKGGLWQITNITCGNAETAPDREFSFDRSGFLLKQVPEPLDSNHWHLVFQEAGVLGHATPLFIDDATVCVTVEGETVTCDDNVLKETAPAHVYGEMSEAGVQVKRIELVQSVSIE